MTQLRLKTLYIAIAISIIISISSSVGIVSLLNTDNKNKKLAEEAFVTQTQGNQCYHGIHHQPNGPFAIMLFCEDAVGSYAAVVCYDTGKCEKSTYPDGSIRFEGWNLNNRVWQDKLWGSDITSFAWSTNEKKLYIATSSIYGSGGIYELELEKRTAKQMLPNRKHVTPSDPGQGYVITSIDKDGESLNYQTIGLNLVDKKLPIRN